MPPRLSVVPASSFYPLRMFMSSLIALAAVLSAVFSCRVLSPEDEDMAKSCLSFYARRQLLRLADVLASPWWGVAWLVVAAEVVFHAAPDRRHACIREAVLAGVAVLARPAAPLRRRLGLLYALFWLSWAAAALVFLVTPPWPLEVQTLPRCFGLNISSDTSDAEALAETRKAWWSPDEWPSHCFLRLFLLGSLYHLGFLAIFMVIVRRAEDQLPVLAVYKVHVSAANLKAA